MPVKVNVRTIQHLKILEFIGSAFFFETFKKSDLCPQRKTVC